MVPHHNYTEVERLEINSMHREGKRFFEIAEIMNRSATSIRIMIRSFDKHKTLSSRKGRPSLPRDVERFYQAVEENPFLTIHEQYT
jgi:transposase